MSSQSQPKLVSNSPAFISIGKTVVANIDETCRRVIDACSIMEVMKVLQFVDYEDNGNLTRIALDRPNGSLLEFQAIFAAVGIPEDRS